MESDESDEASRAAQRSGSIEERLARIARIESSAAFVRADRDLELLARSELRPTRLALEYLKPELALSEHGVEHTIVVFGSTRLVDPDLARERLARLEASNSDPHEIERARAALGRSEYYEVGRELGRIVGCCGCGPRDNRLVVVTGGGPGGMEAANRGADEVGACSVGLNITLPREQRPNPYITPELCFEFRYFALRKLHFLLRAKALVALPGGFGTLDELFETLCLIQTGKLAPLPVILIGESYWQRVIDFDFLVEEGMIDSADRHLFTFEETAEGAWAQIVRWYEERGQSIFDPAHEAPVATDGSTTRRTKPD